MDYDDKFQISKKTILNKIVKIGGYSLAGLTGIIMFSSGYFKVEDGMFAVYQNTLTGAKSVVHGPQTSLRLPFFSIDTHYKYSTSLDFENQDAINVRFADTYSSKIPMSARLEIPKNDESILKIHASFRSYDNLVDKLFEKTLKDVAVNTATQYTGEEFFQGALNEFKIALSDQANNGILKTRRIQIEDNTFVNSSVGVGEDKDKAEIAEKKNIVWRTVPQLDKDGKSIRVENPLAQYSVVVTQINIGNPVPEDTLQTLLVKKKELVAKKIEITQRQENAKAEAQTAKLEGETNRIKAEQQRLLEADAEVIKQKKEVELAKLQADQEKIVKEKEAAMAKIDKQKELDIANSNLNIQKANALAAEFEAKAIKEKGLAQAQVQKAMYEAKDPSLYALEKQVEITSNLKDAFENIKVEMPEQMIINGGNGSTTPINSVDTVLNLLQLEKLKDIKLEKSSK